MSWSVQSYLVGWVAVCSCSTVKAPRWPPSWPRGWSGVFYSLQCRVRCYSGSSPGCTWCHWYLSCVSHCGPKPHSSPRGWACPLNRWASWAGTWPRGRGTWCWDRTEQEERRSGIDSRKKKPAQFNVLHNSTSRNYLSEGCEFKSQHCPAVTQHSH